MRAHTTDPVAALVLLLALWSRLEGRPGASARLVAARASGRAKPRLRADERVMTKVAVYGFVRIVFDLLGKPAWWASLVVLGSRRTAVLGVLYALMQHDLKRLLAYPRWRTSASSSSGLAWRWHSAASSMGLPAALALTAALFHVLNHSLFKSLLFFGSGAILTATGERNMEQLGGLIHRMPRTAVAFLIGCAAISALPPLNGFVSEWLTFQAILIGPRAAAVGYALHDPDGGRAAGAFGGAGGRLLRQGLWRRLPRPAALAEADAAQEVDRWSLAAMFMLAALCFLAGVLPGLFIDLLGARRAAAGRRPPADADRPAWASIVPIAEGRSSYDGLVILVFLAISACHRHVRPPLRDQGDAAKRHLGLRLSGSRPSPSTPARALPCRSAAPSAPRSSWCVKARHAAPGRNEGRAFPGQGARSGLALMYGAGGAGRASRRRQLNQLQFLTIRRYLTLVFATLVLLLWWHGADRPDLRPRRAGVADDLVLAWRRWSSAVTRKVKARLLRRIGPPLGSLISILEAAAQGGGARPQRLVALPRRALLVFAATWVAAALVPTYATDLMFSWSADLIAIVALLATGRFALALAGMDVAPLRRHRLARAR